MAAPDVGPGGPGGREEPPPQGPPQAVGLTWRLRGRASFEALRREGRRRGGRLLVVTWCDDGSDPPRVGYAIGRRHGGAVERNRLRRRLRAVTADLSARGAVPPGTWLVSARPGAGGATGDDLRADLTRIMSTMHEGSRG